MTITKKRLDTVVQEKYPHLSKTYIQSLIMQGKVKVDGKIINKAGTPFSLAAQIEVDDSEPKYVSRAGLKLEKALDHFAIDVNDLVVLDAGISTGGFTDVLLQRGVKKVYGVDVGYGQVHEKIRTNSRVILLERINLRTLESLPEIVDLVTLDLSFISVLKVMDTVDRLLKSGGKLVVLIKPQFEAERGQVGKGGIIKDPEIHQAVVEKVVNGIEQHRFVCKGVIESPITGADGNKEFLACFVKNH